MQKLHRRFRSTGKSAISLILSVCLVAPSLSPAAPSNTRPDISDLKQDAGALFWSHLDLQAPWLTEFALSGSKGDFPLSQASPSLPFADANPFFIRSQSWEPNSNRTQIGQKDGTDLLIHLEGLSKTLRLHEPMSLILQTEEYIFLAADSPSFFAQKMASPTPAGEGLFFMAKKDLRSFAKFDSGVPIFFMPLPDPGWTGKDLFAAEVPALKQIVVQDRHGFKLPVQIADIRTLERVGRDNFLLATAWSFLEGQVSPQGVALPKPYTTLAFGTFVSGVLPNTAAGTASSHARPTLKSFAQMLERLALPSAEAREDRPDQSWLEQLRSFVKQKTKPVEAKTDRSAWPDYAIPTALWGGRFLLAYLAYDHVDWTAMIPPDLPHRIATVAQIMGGVAVATVALRYSVYKALFSKKYPSSPDQSLLQKLNNEHKAFLDVFTHSSYFSTTLTPQSVRHLLEYLKDRFLPSNKMISRAWEETMGFQMRQNSQLAMNWKTWWYGVWVHGGLDCLAIFTDLMIFMPFAAQHLGWGTTGGVAGAFVVYEVFRNFQEYFKQGAHIYSADVKQIHILTAERTARAKMDLEGLDPESPRHQDRFNDLVENELAKIYKTVGLPDQSEFLFDTNTVLQKLTQNLGYGPNGDHLSSKDREELEQLDFILSQRHWGLVKPALKQALNSARETYQLHPTDTGKKTVQLLESTLNLTNRSLVAATAKGVASSIVTADGRLSLQKAIQNEINDHKAKSPNASRLDLTRVAFRGAFKYYSSDTNREARDQRMVLWLMSVKTSPDSVAKFMPPSWIQRAGNETVAYLGASFFHRAFMSLLEKNPSLITAAPEARAHVETRAQHILDAAEKRSGHKPTEDAFEREVKTHEIVQQLIVSDRERTAILNFKPADSDALSKKQWAIARSQAENLWNEESTDEQLISSWSGIAKAFSERTGLAVDPTSWISDYRYRVTVAREFAKQVDLYIETPQQSPFVHGVLEVAALNTEKQLAQEREVAYMTNLDPEERRFYEAQVFTAHFTDAYIERSVHSNDHLYPPISTEYPGRFQNARIKIVGLPGERVMSFFIRSAESFYRNEASAYRAGKAAWFDRKVPVIPDIWLNFKTNARMLPYGLTLSYATSYFIWQVQSPYLLFAISSVMGFIHPTLVAINNRFWRNHGMDPMRNAGTQASYTFTHGLMTNVEPAVIGATGDTLNKVAQGVAHSTSSMVSRCVQALTGSSAAGGDHP